MSAVISHSSIGARCSCMTSTRQRPGKESQRASFFQGGRDGNICREMLLGFLIRAVAKYDQHNGGLNQHHRHNPNNPEWPPLATNERRLSIYQQTLTPPKHAITKLACQLCGERLKMPLVCRYLFALTLLN